ncbi:pre-toxin TG domain-containing protein [Paenibacillus larvae]|uniref:pre-toxin TG domain-containing protein n=2 Tax=Paenibacillus larvae TaxID=1464 RepID=UPI0022816072|nr:pre-toxin TG domain-containing protein [Paenibacillus larvae]MCY7478754.1 pre-toxin TG domain-containing protein [Paenibacillus larvae]MDE5165350.1 pre-toxin TG domain-containing protein [Paenibacillus larvae subsp. larvae]
MNGNPVSYVDPFGLSRDSDTSPYAHAANFVLDFIPFVGSIKGAFEAFTGVDVITGETLSASDRWAAGIGSVLGALPIPGAKQGGKYLTKGTIELEEQLEKSLVSAGTSKYRLPMDLQLFAGKGKGKNTTTLWDMPRGGGKIGERRYSEHALERMAPDTIQVRAELERRAIEKGLKSGTKEFKNFVDPRGIPPMVVEDTIKNVKPVAGNKPNTLKYDGQDVTVILNTNGDVITVIPR